MPAMTVERMTTSRMEAFSDGVIAILITIMVLDLHVPHGATWSAFRPELPLLGVYVLSFVNLGIYWNNHHHLLHQTETVTATILWANLHLLFWLSLIPFSTEWVGENHFGRDPIVGYGIVLLANAAAYFLLQRAIIASQGPDSRLQAAVGRDLKGKASPIIYIAGIAGSFLDRWVGLALYIVVAVMWFIPDRRLEPAVRETANSLAGLPDR